MMKLIIKFFQVGCGDCISIRFTDRSNGNFVIIVDSGYPGTYIRTLHQEAKQLKQAGQIINLFVITHTDQDHIGGMKSFLKNYQTALVDSFWFNWIETESSPFILEPERKASSIRQAIDLRDELIKEGKLNKHCVLALNKETIGNASLIVLSPSFSSYQKMVNDWKRSEQRLQADHKKASSKGNDYDSTIEGLCKIPFEEDKAPENGSSIAFLFEWNSWKGLFLADAHPSIIEASLRELGHSKDLPLKVDLMKVAHHGSSGNTSSSLLELIDCSTFVISANGINKDNLPTKEALARIATSIHRADDVWINFVFNHDNTVLRSIFTDAEKNQFRINCFFPPSCANAYEYTYEQSEY